MKAYKWINTVAFAMMILINAIFGRNTGLISQKYYNLFTPAPITFAIWGAIYALGAVFLLYQWGIFDRNRISSAVRDKIGLWFSASCSFNILWMITWHYDLIGLSLVCMLGLLLSLIVIQRKLQTFELTGAHRFAAKTGFDMYFGWIIVATIANISVLLTKVGWNGFGLPDQFWTCAVILAGTGIGILLITVGNNIPAVVSMVWAYTGILIRYLSDMMLSYQYPFITVAAALGIVIMGIAALFRFRRNEIDGWMEVKTE